MKNLLILMSSMLLFSIEVLGQSDYSAYEKGGEDNCIVGKIDDEFSITPNGQVAYEIPIKTVAGTGGMAPALSISYNSGGKDGLCGYGFDLTGLSYITRAPHDLFHDGKTGTVNLNDKYSFLLDGVRLVYKEESSDTITFVTENGLHTKVKCILENKTPKSFIAYTKDGLIYEYSSDNSLYPGGSSGNPLFWAVTKVSDTKGNYYKVVYTGNSRIHELRPTAISYTGNEKTGLPCTSFMKFIYHNSHENDSTINSMTSFVAGKRIMHNQILSQIEIYNGNSIVRKYTLQYTYNKHYRLSKLTETAANGESLNSTKFNWYEDNSKYIQDRTPLNEKYTADYKNTFKLVGDFNGDGKSDFAIVGNSGSPFKGWGVYISNGEIFTEFVGTFGLSVAQAICGDFNGDGLADIAVKTKLGKKSFRLTVFTCHTSTSNIYFSNAFEYNSTEDFTMQTVETNGDGLADLFLWYKDSKSSTILYSHSEKKSSSMLAMEAGRDAYLKWDIVRFADFDGDGLTDVLNTTKYGSQILYNCGLKTTDLNWTETLTKDSTLILGDFNGDGKTDYIVSSSTPPYSGVDLNSWHYMFSDGNGDFVRQHTDVLYDTDDYDTFVADLNGDGSDDLFVVHKTENNKPIKIYLNNKYGIFDKQENSVMNLNSTNNIEYYFGDFNGDFKTDILFTVRNGSESWNGYKKLAYNSGLDMLLESITDGMGNVIKMEYARINDANTVTLGNTYNYPLVSFSCAWPVVSRVYSLNSLGGYDIQRYKYKNPLVHKYGKGVVGFEEVEMYDETSGFTTSTKYAFMYDKANVYPSNVTVKKENNLISVTENTYGYAGNGYVSFIFPKETTTLTYDYDLQYVTNRTETKNDYDAYGNLTSSLTTTGDLTIVNTNTYTNDEDKWHIGRLTKSVVTKTNTEGTVTLTSEYRYDNDGLLVEEAFEPGESNGYKKTYIRDLYGNITQSSTIPNDCPGKVRTERTIYDSKGRYTVKSINALGHETTYSINEDLGVATSSTDPNGITTSFMYDSFGNLKETTTPLETTRTATCWAKDFAYAPKNSLYFTYTASTGTQPVYKFYDRAGRVLRTATQTYNGNIISVDVVYDTKGNVIKQSEPYFYGLQATKVYWTENTYDDVNRIVSQKHPNGETYTFEYSGLKTTTTDPLGRSTSKLYNQNGLLVKSTDAMGGTVTFEYDANGKPVKTQSPRTTIRAKYDKTGNRIKLYDPDMGIIENTYNGFGEVTSQKDNRGSTTYEYDNGGRIVTESTPDGAITYEYDTSWIGALGKKESQIGEVATSEETIFDDYGRPVQTSTTIGDENAVTEISYNSMNKVDVTTYPNGLKVKNHYHSDGTIYRVSNVMTGQSYWTLGSINARGEVTNETLGNGVQTTIAYDDALGCITGIVSKKIGQDWTYTYNKVGNLTSRKDNNKNLEEQFYYDDLDRLVGVVHNGVEVSTVKYDNAGNILSKSDVSDVFHYKGGTNRLIGVSLGNNNPLTFWDAIRYNSFNKITFIKHGADSMRLWYGADKSRCLSRKAASGEVSLKYYFSKLYELEQRKGGERQTCYIYANGRPVALAIRTKAKGGTGGAMSTTDDLLYLHYDHLSSVCAYSKGNGVLESELSYDAWGRRRDPKTWIPYDFATEAQARNDRGFTGHEHIDIFELVNMDGRVYDPMTGRFLSPDPFIQAPDFTQSYNRYAYCLNNPLSLVDPTGYSWFSKNWKSLLASAVGIAVGALTAGTGTSFGMAIVAGAAGGAAGAMTGAILNGANIWQVAKSTFTGAFWGAVSGAFNWISYDKDIIATIFKHAFTEALFEGAQGGNMFHGAIMGALSTGGNTYIKGLKVSDGIKILASSVLGGSVSEIGGGKFANGAITSAFHMMFNDLRHPDPKNNRQLKHDLVFPNKNYKNPREALKAAIRYMAERTKYTGNEIAAAVLADGSVVVFSDGNSTSSESYVKSAFKDGKYYYKNVEIRSIMHTHPSNIPTSNVQNPLNISRFDLELAKKYNCYISIISTKGDFYHAWEDGMGGYYTQRRFNVYR